MKYALLLNIFILILNSIVNTWLVWLFYDAIFIIFRNEYECLSNACIFQLHFY